MKTSYLDKVQAFKFSMHMIYYCIICQFLLVYLYLCFYYCQSTHSVTASSRVYMQK